MSEIALRDVFVTVGDYIALARRKLLWLILGGVVGGGLAAAYASSLPETYEAQLTFLVDEDVSGGAGVGGVLSAFGLGGAATEVNTDKVLALTRSQMIAQAVLLDSTGDGTAGDLIVNRVIESEGLVEEFDLEAELGITRVESRAAAKGDRRQRALLKSMYKYSVYKPGEVLRASVDEDSGIFTISSTVRDEQLAVDIVESAYRHLDRFYQEENLGGRRSTVQQLQIKADSIDRELKRADYRLASTQDTRLGLIQQRDRVPVQALSRQVSILTLAYGEVLKNLESARFALVTATPYFQVVDAPYTPLENYRAKPWLWAIVGGVFTAFCVYVALAAHYFYSRTMHADHS